MTEFNEFKKKVCNFYRQNKELTYFVYVDSHWQYCSVVVEFKTVNVKIVYSYELSTEYTNVEQRNKKAERLMKEISKDLQGIKNEC
ncbi:MAG: hypothetical protein II453_01415 [Alphaproteobacteria bacterium]|nr:hypothetical protein [Alphaproteobacteria bacterium]